MSSRRRLAFFFLAALFQACGWFARHDLDEQRREKGKKEKRSLGAKTEEERIKNQKKKKKKNAFSFVHVQQAAVHCERFQESERQRKTVEKERIKNRQKRFALFFVHVQAANCGRF